MIVTNAQGETAIVVRRDGQSAAFVRLKAGRLNCEHLAESDFRAAWHESPFPLAETLTRFLEHGRTHGATQEALKGLTRLQERERNAVTRLF